MAKQKFSVSALMSEQSKAQAKMTNESRTIDIPLDMIDPAPENRYSMDGIEELAASIETVGLLQSPLVRQKADGRYAIISGHRRRAALQLLVDDGNERWRIVPDCTVIKSDSDVIAELQLIMANSTSRIMTDADKVYQAERLRELLLDLKRSGYKFGMRMRDVLAQMMQTSATQAGRYESISINLIPEWRVEFDAQKITITNAYELSRRSEDDQRNIYEGYKGSGAISFPLMAADTGGTEAAPRASQEVEPEAAYERRGENTRRKADVGETQRIVDKAREIRAEQKADRAAAMVDDGMEGGIQSGARIEAARPPVAAATIHVVRDTFERIVAGEVVCFEEYKTGRRVAARVVVVEE